MPMIVLTVPPRTTRADYKEVDLAIVTALRAEGIQGGITVWPVMLATIPDRLLLEYKTRQEISNPDRIARLTARAAERIFGIQVESVVIKLDPAVTGFYMTPKR